MACDMCGDKKKIYDWNPNGDPCPECTGGRFHASSEINMRTQNAIYNTQAKWGCAVVALACLSVAILLTVLTAAHPM